MNKRPMKKRKRRLKFNLFWSCPTNQIPKPNLKKRRRLLSNNPNKRLMLRSSNLIQLPLKRPQLNQI